MTLEQQTVSLPIAKQLKELGVPQDSLCYWVEPIHSDRKAPFVQVQWPAGYVARPIIAAAFTVAELGELLPNYSTTRRPRCRLKKHDPEVCGGFHQSWECSHNTLPKQWAHTEADARGKMLIYLLEHFPALRKTLGIQEP